MQGSDITVRDCFIRLRDPTGRHAPIVTHHRVWDFQRFITAQRDTYENKAKGDDKRVVEVCDEAQYIEFMRKQRSGT